MLHRQFLLQVCLLAACLAVPFAVSVAHAIPVTTAIEGFVTATGGGPAADGEYTMTFSLYAQADSPAAAWQETSIAVGVKNGQFSHSLGSLTPISAQTLANLKAPLLGIRIAMEPELSRAPLQAVPFAWRAAAAESLACSGCVTADMIDPKALAKVAGTGQYADLVGAPDFSQYAKFSALADVALSGAYADLEGAPSLVAYAKWADLAKVATTGKYADLLGAPELGKACGTGLVMQGLKADGSYDCVGFSALPPDGLNEVSNNLLTNEIVDTTASTKAPVAIPDNNPLGASDEILVPDVGLVRKIAVNVEVTNSDLSTVKVTLFDPAGTSYVLHDKTGKAGDTLKTSFPAPTKTLTGDLTTWIGQNPKGKWRIEAIDGKFLNNSADGAIVVFSVSLETLSSTKVEAKGALLLTGGVKLPVSAGPPFACDTAHYGYEYLNSKTNELNVCVGVWSVLMMRSCGNGVVETPEECDAGNANADVPDKCRTTCVKPKCGDKIIDFGESCDDGNNIVGDGCDPGCAPPVSVTFSTCSATGVSGPSQAACNTAYAGTDLNGKVTIAGSGVQLWTVPYTATYQIEAFGARGGNAPGNAGGAGARMRGNFQLTKDAVLNIIVGQMGGDSQSSGGGGGSFVAVGANYGTAVALLVAGGGGGGRSSSYTGVGAPGNVTTSGSASAYAGGINGNGGARNASSVGGFAGGGFLTDGLQVAGNSGKSGYAFRNGGSGGVRQDNGANLCADGGFGGGGGGMHNQNQGSGGGGGYSGGGAGHDTGPSGWGGGGGSFNSGTDPSNSEGANATVGKVTIKIVP